MSIFEKLEKNQGTISSALVESLATQVVNGDKQILLKALFPEKHDKNKIAELIFKSDEEMNSLVYGNNAIKVIKKLLDIKESYFVPEHTKYAFIDDELAGVVIYYSSDESIRKQVDKIAAQGFMKAMGFFSFIKKMSLYMKMDKMLGGVIEGGGLYIHTICIDEKFRGRGIGSKIINELEKENKKMYLYVNAGNERAIRFYEKSGFVKKFLGRMNYKEKDYAEYLMEKMIN